MKFGRVLTAMVTPFDHTGEIDYDQTDILIEYLLENGTDGLVIAGTTGESPTLSVDEKVNLFKHVVKVVNKRVPVIAGTGSNSTAASIQLTEEAEKSGVDAVMLVAPYYNKPNQRGMYEHFKTIANATSLPVMLYNIPGRSVVKLTADTIIELSKISNIVSVKESTGDLDQAAEIIENTSDDFSLYSGDDSMTLPMLSIGADGIISVASHIVGNEMQEMVNLYLDGDVKQAAAKHRKLVPVMNALFTSPSPTPVKAALQMKGIETGSVRLPLLPLTDDERNLLKEKIDM
ncbi:4-hydroxy-tetrahydrodipicolinate synthase [Oceanobacillus picturae]|jgi:4-hydroxy-tetrahydrodipicolinate synthase|uniref:4-hydroxy-tetrahydrodipicolinate synthase n=1 Tax=Oceanobacillus picturae TaxID=171693 RepID=W9A8V1_9BACI|nr:4-hydroxy-tetrahydrodipicolinate synthase [Oceanobacillus picturae]RIU96313.1 4-hydroxy-tetrahydrodipicolinate synthase [Oceanobacillus picturae]GAQ16151.1 4-hydroxy-tetrahydrodipicolinate synthase [Oceanobacillus picturae]CDO02179.1 4-hydroxy-tetrahydrodipicolinate synthase [Oceanobacillus picturae]